MPSVAVVDFQYSEQLERSGALESAFPESPCIWYVDRVDGDDTINGEFTDCEGVPDLVTEVNILCWLI